MSLIRLIYVSSAVSKLDDAKLDAILASSVRHNQQRQITGMLLYADGNFIQVLEGEAVDVEDIFDRIMLDPRHHDVFLLDKSAIDARSFSKWAMGFRRLSIAEVLVEYRPFFQQSAPANWDFVSPGVAFQILEDFASRV